MEALKGAGAGLISYLQYSWLSGHAVSLHQLQYYCSPATIMMVLCPALLAVQGTVWGKTTVSGTVALQTIWTAIVSIRLNTFRQWTLGEDRPYWWRRDAEVVPYFAEGPDSSSLHQYPVTCLSAPPAPVYSLLAAGVGLVLVSALTGIIRQLQCSPLQQQVLELLNQNQQQRQEKLHRVQHQQRLRWAVRAVWGAYVLGIIAVALADCFFATHFPHQVLLSVVLGVLVAIMMLRADFSQPSSLKKTVAINIALLAFSLSAMYKGEAMEGFNKFQKLAFKWCDRREWLQIDPAPLLDVVTCTGYALGISAATVTSYYRKLNKQRFSVKMIVSVLILNASASSLLLLLPDGVPRSIVSTHRYLWYSCHLVSSVLVPFVCGALVPSFVQRASGIPAAAKLKKT